MSKQFWIDLTDISDWTGNFTGIQRVVYNLALYFYTNNEAKFFRYDENTRRFYTADFAAIKRRFETVLPSNTVKAKDYKLLIFSAYAALPSRLREVVPPSAKRAIRKRAKQVLLIARKIAASKPIVTASPQVIFSPGDTVVVFGNNWDRSIFIDDLARVKLEKGFEVYQLVYDLIPILGPHLFGQELFSIYARYIFEVAAVSDRLFCISRSTEYDLKVFCAKVGLAVPETKVVRLGDSLASVKPEALAELKGQKFVVCVGTIEIRKNHMLLYYAWKEAVRRGKPMPQLVIVGRPGWHTEDLRRSLKHDPDVAKRILVLEHVKDSELRWLYENCMFSIYPSMYEGWGLPIAESLSYGKLCLASNTSSMPEIAGNLIDYFSPYDSGECLEKVLEYYENEQKLSRKEAKIIKHYKTTDWRQTYEEVKGFLNS